MGAIIFIFVVGFVFNTLLISGVEAIQAYLAGITTGLIVLSILGFGIALQLLKALKK